MIGVMWYDNRGSPLEEIVALAAKRYRAKFGRRATLALVHPAMVDEPRDMEIDGAVVRVEPAGHMLPGHMLVGEANA